MSLIGCLCVDKEKEETLFANQLNSHLNQHLVFRVNKNNYKPPDFQCLADKTTELKKNIQATTCCCRCTHGRFSYHQWSCPSSLHLLKSAPWFDMDQGWDWKASIIGSEFPPTPIYFSLYWFFPLGQKSASQADSMMSHLVEFTCCPYTHCGDLVWCKQASQAQLGPWAARSAPPGSLWEMQIFSPPPPDDWIIRSV